jgi:GTP-binding protein EngB required for normal cell division
MGLFILVMFILANAAAAAPDVHIAVFGMSGVGKSSLVNALCQGNVSAVSSTHEVRVASTIGECIFYDTPGYGTRTHRVKGHLKHYLPNDRLIVVAIGHRLYEADDDFVKDAHALGYEVVVVRTKTDIYPRERATPGIALTYGEIPFRPNVTFGYHIAVPNATTDTCALQTLRETLTALAKAKKYWEPVAVGRE